MRSGLQFADSILFFIGHHRLNVTHAAAVIRLRPPCQSSKVVFVGKQAHVKALNARMKASHPIQKRDFTAKDEGVLSRSK